MNFRVLLWSGFILGLLAGIVINIGLTITTHQSSLAEFSIIVIIAGAMGGLAYSLSTDDGYTLKIPGKGENIQTGFLGHMITGAITAIVIVPLAANILGVESIWPSAGQMPTLQSYSYLIAMSAIGGFGGLKFLQGVSEAINKRINELQQKSDKISKQIEDTSSEQLLARARDKIVAKRYHEALLDLEEAIKIHPSGRAYGLKAIGLRHTERLSAAIKTIEEGLKLDATTNSDKALLHWNLGCYNSLMHKNIDVVIKNISDSVGINSDYKADIVTEDDLEFARSNEQFTNHFEL